MSSSASTHAQTARDVVSTETEAATLSMPPLLVEETIRQYLDDHSIGSGPLSIDPVGEGQSNATFRIRREGADVILRRGPRPPLPKSTHDMVREARVQTALADFDFPVPNIRSVYTEDDLLGVPFYIMDRLDGDVVTSKLPERFEPVDRRRTLVERAVATLAQLHSLDVSQPSLADVGRPNGYLERQVNRFTKLWPQNTLREIPLVDRLSTWLSDNLPATQRHSVIHGDYRIGNLMFAPEEQPQIQAVLDWEMATLGDPLADLGYVVATYATPGVQPTVMELTTVTREPDFPKRHDLIELYSQDSDLDLSELHWYQTLALWKSAIFCEAIYTRWLKGERPNDKDFGRRLENGVPELLESAWEYTK